MHVRSFEIGGTSERDLRTLHDYLLEVGGFAFRAGGIGFFVVVGERFSAATGATNAQLVLASRESDTISVDLVAVGGDLRCEDVTLSQVQRLTELLRAFAQRHGLLIADI